MRMLNVTLFTKKLFRGPRDNLRRLEFLDAAPGENLRYLSRGNVRAHALLRPGASFLSLFIRERERGERTGYIWCRGFFAEI